MTSRRITPRQWWTVTVIYAALTVAMVYPLSLHPADHVASLGTDTDLPVWTLAWDVHAFVHHPFSIFDANIFYPFKHTLAYSENLVGSALLAAPVIWITGNPVLAMNLVVLAAILLSAMGAYWLGRELGLSHPAATLCGLVFGFTPPHLLRLEQFHLITIEWVPFALAAAHRYLRTDRRRDVWLAIGFFSLQAITSGHGGALLTLAFGLLILVQLAAGTPVALVRRVRDVGVPGLLLVVPAALIYLPYREAQVEIGFRRALDDWGIATSSFFMSPSYAQQWLLAHLPNWPWLQAPPDAWLFPGLLPIALAGFAFAGGAPRGAPDPRWWRRWRANQHAWLYLIVLLFCLWLAVGPPWGVWRWVYWLPGLNFMRVPSRFMLLGMLALGVLAGFGFDRLADRRLGARRSAVAVIVGVLLVAEFACPRLDGQPYRVPSPSVEQWLATRPRPFSLLELPVSDSRDPTRREERNTLFMLYSLTHYQPIFEGYSGTTPPGYEALHDLFAGFPDAPSLQAAMAQHYTYVVMHWDLVPAPDLPAVHDRFDRWQSWLTPLAFIEGGQVFVVHPPGR